MWQGKPLCNLPPRGGGTGRGCWTEIIWLQSCHFRTLLLGWVRSSIMHFWFVEFITSLADTSPELKSPWRTIFSNYREFTCCHQLGEAETGKWGPLPSQPKLSHSFEICLWLWRWLSVSVPVKLLWKKILEHPTAPYLLPWWRSVQHEIFSGRDSKLAGHVYLSSSFWAFLEHAMSWA